MKTHKKRPESIDIAATSEQPAKIQASPINLWLDYATCLQVQFNKFVNQNPTVYAEKICVGFLADCDKDIIHEEKICLEKLQKSIYKCQNKVLQLCGIGDECSRVDCIRKAICTTITWVEEIFCYAIIDWAEVQQIHGERGFVFHSD